MKTGLIIGLVIASAIISGAAFKLKSVEFCSVAILLLCFALIFEVLY